MRLVSFLLVLFTCGACHSQPLKSEAGYPPEWWTPVAREGAPAWEILPQEAAPHEVILSKRTELGIFSNFAATPFLYRGRTYASVEGFWQMMKYPEGADDERMKRHPQWPHTRAEVGQMTAFDAKHAGDEANAIMKELNFKWVTFEGRRLEYLEPAKGDFYHLIWDAEMAKMNQNPNVRDLLVKTGDLILKPDHKQYGDEAPAWKYFDMWMEIRSGLK